jgi:hypothetical protein
LKTMDMIGCQFQETHKFIGEMKDRYETLLQLNEQQAIARGRQSLNDIELNQPRNPELQMPDRKFAKLADKVMGARDKALKIM